MERFRLASLLRRAERVCRRGIRPRFVALRVEVLEERRLLHAGHDDEPLTFPEIPAQSPTAEEAIGSNPLSSIPALNSLPGAAVSVFLDFDGFFEANWGSYQNITTPVFDKDGDPTTFSDNELTTISNIWAQVSEDIAPFKVNVTTVQPPSFSNGVAVRAAIGGNGEWSGGTYGGIAYVNSFTNSIPNTVYIFSNNLGGGSAKSVSEATSHETGHAFGLQHQSQYDANGQQINEYYAGPGNGTAPIMGNSYSATRGLWWYGTSTSATTFQDDMSVISRSFNGFGYRPDDHANSAPSATPLSESGGLLLGTGVITTTSDVDYFSFDTDAGQVTLLITVPSGINNLDARLELRNAAGALITSAAPSGSFGASIVANLAAGSYRAVVASQGNYGDVGQYTLTTELPVATPAATVLARALFYNQSSFDGNSAAINANDDSAIAIDKVAYLPGAGIATSANISSYTRGINGIMLDVANLGATITANDFVFKVGANNSPASWTNAPGPTAVVVRAGAGVSGSDRVEIVWADGVIQNTYLQVIVEGNDAIGGFNSNTGLASSDVFFFGNRVGDSGTGTPATLFETTSTDAVQVFASITGSAAIDNLRDYNRSGDVTSTDAVLVFANIGILTRIDIGAGGPFAPAGVGPSVGDEAGAAITLALAAPSTAGAAAANASIAIAAAASALATLHSAELPEMPSSISALPARVEPPAKSTDAPISLAVAADAARDRVLSEVVDDLVDTLGLDEDLLDSLTAALLV